MTLIPTAVAALRKPHYKGGGDCLYCENINPRIRIFPTEHSHGLGHFVHTELQHSVAVPGVSPPMIHLVLACESCDHVDSIEFFQYVKETKPYSDLTPGELLGLVLGKMHVLQSEASMITNYTDDPNLHPRERSQNIEMLRAQVHVAVCEVLDRMKDEAVEILPDAHNWQCCEQQRPNFISGGRSSEEYHTVTVCDSCGQFRVWGHRNNVHFSVHFSLFHPNAVIAAGRPVERIQHDEPASPHAELTVKATKTINTSATAIETLLKSYGFDEVMGNETKPNSPLMDSDVRILWRLARSIVEATKKK